VARAFYQQKEHDPMMSDAQGGPRTLGTLRVADGAGVVRLQERIDTDIDDLWSALTEPDRLGRWLGKVDGELLPGGEFRGHWFASGWEGTCRVVECERPRRLLLLTASPDQPDGVIEVTLTADGNRAILVIEDRGMPVQEMAAYGAGDQIHVEDLVAYLAGGEPCDARVRWNELEPAYRRLAADPR
jgi:uncharacterized protein YndB with AHSA1/START domain